MPLQNQCPNRLVFIFGIHRSGTSILYNVLSRHGAFRFPTPFHIATFDAYRAHGFEHALLQRPALESRFKERSITTRFIDDIPATLDTPEEYGFMLKGGSLTGRTMPQFQAMCDFIAEGGESDRKTLLLKNPRDFRNLTNIQNAFPQSKIIIIHRRPEEVLFSRARELRDLFNRKSEYQAIIEPFYERLSSSKNLSRALRAATRCDPMFHWFLSAIQIGDLNSYIKNRAALQTENIIEIRYEDLCLRPQAELGRIFQFLEMTNANLTQASAAIRAPRTTPEAQPPGGSLLRTFADNYYERWNY